MASNQKQKEMEEFLKTMPDPEALFKSWWPFIIAGSSGILYGLRQWFRGAKCVGGANLGGKTVIVTGASSGIGREIAMNFAKRAGKVILACRDEAKGKLAAEEIRKETENTDVFFMKLDLCSFKSIVDFVERFKKKESALHILMNNAGVMMCPAEKTEDGFDVQFQTNYLGPFLLTELLLDMLKASAPSRIINTTAAAQNLGDIDFSDINLDKKPTDKAGDMYAQSKLAVILHTFQLAERLKDTKVTCNVVNPGICNTDIYRHLPLKQKSFIRISFAPFMWFMMKTGEDGAQMAIYCATVEDVAETTGKFFKECKEHELTGKAVDKLLQEQLYRASVKWVKASGANIEVKALEGTEDIAEYQTEATEIEKQKEAEEVEKEEDGKSEITASKMERVSLS